MTREKRKPAGGNLRASGAMSGLRALYGNCEATPSRSARKVWQSPRLPHDWRDRLPDAGHYYPQHVAKLGRPNASGWAQGRCPLHEDHDASLSVQTAGQHGGWRCFAGCGKGDMVAFHMRLRGCDFRTAVAELLRGGA